MTDIPNDPFQPGSEVYVLTSNFDNEITKIELKKVRKIYKNGNFVLDGDKDQWISHYHSWTGNPHWSASRAGMNNFNRSAKKKVLPKDEATDKQIQSIKDRSGLRREQIKLRLRIDENYKKLTIDQILQINYILDES